LPRAEAVLPYHLLLATPGWTWPVTVMWVGQRDRCVSSLSAFALASTGPKASVAVWTLPASS
jgi:hypothetical protein